MHWLERSFHAFMGTAFLVGAGYALFLDGHLLMFAGLFVAGAAFVLAVQGRLLYWWAFLLSLAFGTMALRAAFQGETLGFITFGVLGLALIVFAERNERKNKNKPKAP